MPLTRHATRKHASDEARFREAPPKKPSTVHHATLKHATAMKLLMQALPEDARHEAEFTHVVEQAAMRHATWRHASPRKHAVVKPSRKPSSEKYDSLLKRAAPTKATVEPSTMQLLMEPSTPYYSTMKHATP
ncbi:unnamed protein product [Prorocentrum cordatum]|uniref:Ribosome biogenesis protein NOP53 n=1 Tax=Prorocentrum cordatum TaxID=2364126 RepID=A0ABN9WMC7_9DINO|nr:unnamed protein product [Polarella glacialis]